MIGARGLILAVVLLLGSSSSSWGQTAFDRNGMDATSYGDQIYADRANRWLWSRDHANSFCRRGLDGPVRDASWDASLARRRPVMLDARPYQNDSAPARACGCKAAVSAADGDAPLAGASDVVLYSPATYVTKLMGVDTRAGRTGASTAV